jgi:hypothetical protein
MNYKGYSLPLDLLLIVYSLWKILFYYFYIRKMPPGDLVESIRCRTAKTVRTDSYGGLIKINKMHRAIGFLLVRVANYPRPCLIRSCVLFEEALKNGLEVQMFIGAKKEGRDLKGHSWITINNQPYRENREMLDNYTVIASG